MNKQTKKRKTKVYGQIPEQETFKRRDFTDDQPKMSLNDIHAYYNKAAKQQEYSLI